MTATDSTEAQNPKGLSSPSGAAYATETGLLGKDQLLSRKDEVGIVADHDFV
jgi:hypothetical protein